MSRPMGIVKPSARVPTPSAVTTHAPVDAVHVRMSTGLEALNGFEAPTAA